MPSPRNLLLTVSLLGLATLILLAPWRRSPPPAHGPDTNSPLSFLRSELLRDFTLAERFERPPVTHHTFTNRDAVLKLELLHDLDPDSAQILVHDGVMGIEALYANALSPYPGDISNKIITKKKFLPQLFRHRTEAGVTNTAFLLYANERLGYGATTDEQVRYKSVLGWIYCPRTRTFVKARYFAPLATPDPALRRFFQSLACP